MSKSRRWIGAGRVCRLAVLLALLYAAPLAAQSVLAEIEVHAGALERVDVPVVATLDRVPVQAAPVRLYETTNGANREIPVQYRAGTPDRIAFILDGTTPAGAVRRFELRAAPPGAAPAPAGGENGGVEVTDNGENIVVSIGGRPVLSYRYATMPVPEGVNPIFAHSGHIHPLWSPGGEVLTRIQAPDHYHHYGIWNPWTLTEFEGRTVDFWNLGSRQGRVRSAGVVEKLAGPVFGGFRSIHEHVDYTSGEEKIAIREQWDVTVWNAGLGGNAWVIDFESTLNPATDAGITIKAYRYQGFSIRATEKWNDQTATLLSSEGRDKSDGNATRARWVDVNGVADVPEGRAGLLMMSNPANYNHPEQLRIWPVGENRGVANVFVNFNPAQEQDWELRPGNTYGLKYRLYVYDGRITPETAERLWRDYADPPRVEVRVPGRQ